MIVASISTIKKFIDQGTTRPTTSSELMAFWKACTDAERQQFTSEAASLMG